MACSHGIDIELLHEFNIFSHAFDRKSPSSSRIVLMTVDSADQNRLPVDAKFSVFDLHTAESNFDTGNINRCLLFPSETDRQGVAERSFRTPRLHLRKLQVQMRIKPMRILQIKICRKAVLRSNVNPGFQHLPSAGFIKTNLEKPPVLNLIRRFEFCHAVVFNFLYFSPGIRIKSCNEFQIQNSGFQILIKSCCGKNILNVIFRCRIQIDISDNPRVPPLILILHISGIGELMHQDRDLIFALPDQPCNIKL